MTSEREGYVLVEAAEIERCPDRCGGRVGHPGPHQSSDYDPALRTSLSTLVEHLTLPANLDDNPHDSHHINDGCVKAARAALATNPAEGGTE